MPESGISMVKNSKLQLNDKQRHNLIYKLCVGGVVAALYIVLALALAPVSFGIVQFRLAEVLTVLPVLSVGAIPGVFIGCLLSNILNPQNLGIVDILGGSLTTLAAAGLSWFLAIPYRRRLSNKVQAASGEESKLQKWIMWFQRVLVLFPPVLLNALVVGSYLPLLLLEHHPSHLEFAGSIAMIFLSQAVVIYAIGLPFLLVLEKSRLPWHKL